MQPPLPPIIDAATLLDRRDGPPVWDDPAVTSDVPFGQPLTYAQIADRVVVEVERDGDDAVRTISAAARQQLPEHLELSGEQLSRAAADCPAEVVEALHLAAARIRVFAEREPVGSWRYDDEGLVVGQLTRPVARVGLYVPGGTAPLASSLLMAAVPARVAGTAEILVCTPPTTPGILPLTAAAALAAGVDRVFTIGGPAAIAALALGTDTVPRCDLLCGPGGGPTIAALARVRGRVGVVSLPGPTETLVIADHTADPITVAADLLAQAEHDPAAAPVLVTTTATMAGAVQHEVGRQLPGLQRAAIARASLQQGGGITVADNVAEAITIANRYAPEHLCLLIADPWSHLDAITDAGGIFVGEHACEALGDYIAGPSHIMPTGGSARWSSPVSVRDFVRMTTVIGANRAAARRLAPPAITLAEAEGLTGHAASLRRRLENP